MRYIMFFIVIALITSFRNPDYDPGKKSGTFTVYINYETYSVRANVLTEASSVHPREGHIYYWYSNNDIKSTEDGFDGKLLHGEYRSFYRDLNLKEQGKFSHGLKTGTWKTWFPGGKMHEIIHYKDGNKNGVMQTFNTEGYLITETNYKNDKINGKQILYKNGKEDTIIRYKNNEKVAGRKKAADSTHTAKPQIKRKDTTAEKPKSSIPRKKIIKNNADSVKIKAPVKEQQNKSSKTDSAKRKIHLPGKSSPGTKKND